VTKKKPAPEKPTTKTTRRKETALAKKAAAESKETVKKAAKKAAPKAAAKKAAPKAKEAAKKVTKSAAKKVSPKKSEESSSSSESAVESAGNTVGKIVGEGVDTVIGAGAALLQGKSPFKSGEREKVSVRFVKCSFGGVDGVVMMVGFGVRGCFADGLSLQSKSPAKGKETARRVSDVNCR
jgi:hypothetical protein